MPDTPASSSVASLQEPKASSSAPASLAMAPAHVANGHSHAVANTKAAESLPNIGEMEAKCGGCQGIIDQEGGGVVVAFGSSLWHVDCFRCAKCKDKVSADTNLLLLSDGSPVCGNCSYQCFVCKQAITEEAIMTGDESYHAHCFTCRTCKRRIEELVFAKTSQGIYCMSCHNERVAKSRRHAEAKRQRAARKEKEREEKERAEEQRQRTDDRDRDKEKERDKERSTASTSSSAIPPHLHVASPNLPSSSSPSSTPLSQDSSRFPESSPKPSTSEEDQAAPRSRDLSIDRGLDRSGSPSGSKRVESPLPPLPPLPHSPSNEMLPSRTRMNESGRSSPGPSAQANTSPSLSPSSSSQPQRQQNVGLGVGPVGLNVPTTTKADKRRSINPAMTFNMDAANSTFAAEPRLSPLPPSPLRASFTDGHRPPSDGMRSPTSPSPLTQSGDGFPFKPALEAPPPPRKSSLDPVSTPLPSSSSRSRSHSTAPVPEEKERHAGGTLPLNVPSKQNQNGNASTPKLNAPTLPTMSFSLSDPDFALLLNGMDGEGKANPQASGNANTNANAGKLVRPEVDLDDSPPPSPIPEIHHSITRSPQMGSLSTFPTHSHAHTHPATSSSSLVSPSKGRLEPGHPPMLRTRQPSAESTTSLTGRFGADSSFLQIVEMVAEAKHTGKEKVEVDLDVLAGVVKEVEDLKEAMAGLRSKYTGAKRSSQQYSQGLTVAGEEYDREVAVRRELEAENSRLRAQVHSQTARLSVMSGDERRVETMRRRSQDLASSLTGLEREMSRLKAQRDMTLAELEELQKRTSVPTSEDSSDVRESLTTRLETIKEQYREELEPLTAQREALQREIADLRETKEQFIEESTALAAKNDELAELNSQLSRQVESIQDALSRRNPLFNNSKRTHPSTSPSISSLATSATLQEVPEETARVVKVTKPDPQPIEAAPARRFKWYGYKSSKGPSPSDTGSGSGSGAGSSGGAGNAMISRPLQVITNGVSAVGNATGLTGQNQNQGQGSAGGGGAGGNAGGGGGGASGGLNASHLGVGDKRQPIHRPSTEFGIREHAFQQHSTMRLTRCELCAEKMWGLQEVRCASCGIVCHSKCAEKLPKSCTGSKNSADQIDGPLPPSMFGRSLSEQIEADRQDVPTIVTKCISAVEDVGMEYEGIYRKTGGSSQSKQITQLFERGDYDAFDLANVEAFNDISSVTSVLKTYFRQLPNPLLTHELHESFVAASVIKDQSNKQTAFLALLKELPMDHYNTLRALMLHLNRVMQAAGSNLMTSQNLGVVFGPTLMRSSDPNREFADMGGKAMCVQWMVDNAPTAFAEGR